MSSIVKANFVVEVPRQQNKPEQAKVSRADQILARIDHDRHPNFQGLGSESEEFAHLLDGTHGLQDLQNAQVSPDDDVSQKTKGLMNEISSPKDPKASEEANAIIAEAREIAEGLKAEAQRLLDEANTKSKDIIINAEKEGFETGFAQGIEEGKTQALEEAKEGLNEIAYFIEMLNMERMQTYKEEEESLVRLSFEIAKKIMRQQIKVEKASIPRMIEDIVKENETAVRIYLSEYNQTLFTRIDRQTREKIKELLPGIKIIIQPNDGAEEIMQIETENGMIDAGVAGQLTRLGEAIIKDK